MPNTAVAGGGALMVTLFGGTLLSGPNNEPAAVPNVFERVNVDDALLSRWLSEDLTSNTDEPLDSECNFYNFSKLFTSPFCDPFSLSRMHKGTIQAAASRALKCAAKHDIECILSPEVGFAVPVAFIAQHGDGDGMKVVVAPRILQADNVSTDYVRMSIPTDTLTTHTARFNNSLNVEFMTDQKRMETAVFQGNDAFCVQLLRVAFDPTCWESLDRV